MTTPDPSPRLLALANRVAWGRLLPAAVLLVVGISQPVAAVPGDDDAVRTLTLLNLLTSADDVLQDATVARIGAALLLLVAVATVVLTFLALENRSNGSRIGVLVFAVATVLLVPVFAVLAANTRSVTASETAGVVAAGLLPLFVGAVATWIAAAGTHDTARLLRAGAVED